MAVETRPVGRGVIEPFKFTAYSAATLFQRRSVDRYQTVYNQIAQGENVFPQNREEELLPELMQISMDKNVRLGDLSPYWLPDKRINPIAIYGALLQFTDYHPAPLPDEVYPPEADVSEYIDRIMQSEGRVTIPEQFAHLLDITDGNFLGALHLGFVSSRVMARGLETRAYPNIPTGEVEMRAWNEKIAQFERIDRESRNDGPGDTYYFWTHMFGAAFFKQYQGIGKRVFDASFDYATPTVRFVRKWFAGMPPNSDHYEATVLGRQLGIALTQFIGEKDKSLT